MVNQQHFPQRKPNRWAGYDYSSFGLYFITIVTHYRQLLFGKVINGVVVLSSIGKMIDGCIREIPEVMKDIEIDDYVVMPNHIHLLVTNFDNTSIVEVIRRLKAKTSFLYHRMMGDAGMMADAGMMNPLGMMGDAGMINHAPTLWQRSYYDRVVRNERECMFIRNYIYKNPERWNKDKLNEDCISDNADDVNAVLHDIQLHPEVDIKHYFD